ncbi:arylamine N-acetyltransferase family protein [Consotaella salsifontis]|uniref:N-hydroxyarylamine O-acetyltransferase n=1 Tax=Consotaella salsifontis TaxID=1365950 RepID=A0A1T4PTE2_9HYPH|nr:arylamine N-acetyltransferase [Consotaella salsifontis]SJZ94709.1 N-hydroxyarylamine O-acetyltransferase [Consotaella salsifontis]
MTFDLQTYFARIGLTMCLPTFDGLETLQRAQMAAIPFEDVEPFLGGVPDLAPDAVWSKLVAQRCGGYCFELNGLFGRALGAVGFAARPILARVRMGAPVGGIRAHLAWIVTVNGREWLADVGFGGPGAFGPLELVVGPHQSVAGTTFRFGRDGQNGETVLERRDGESWLSLYSFDESPFTAVDIDSANYLCTRWSAGAPFSRNLMISRAGPEAQLTLMNREAREVTRTGARSWTITSPGALERLIVEDFGLNYDRATIGALWEKLSAGQTEMAA